MIDTAVQYENAEGKEYAVQLLIRMLCLRAWDVYVPVTYLGAPPVCHFCRQSGHIRATYLVLAKRQCFKCRKLGHTAQFCREEEATFEDALDEYEASKKATDETATANTQRRTQDSHQEKRQLSTPTILDLVEQATTAVILWARYLCRIPQCTMSHIGHNDTKNIAHRYPQCPEHL